MSNLQRDVDSLAVFEGSIITPVIQFCLHGMSKFKRRIQYCV